uniref:Serine_rich domain-containing protein n=1 Tax=Macrostomum lignano TaxID=282301 RepID=A0A1I8GFK0_9PLAT
APDDAEGGKSTKRKKSPAARQDAATTAAAANASLRQGQQSSSAWDLYDNTGSQPAAVADSPSAVHHSQSPPTSTSSPSLPTQQVNGGASGSNLLLFLGRQPKSVRFNDSQAAGNFGNSAGVGAGGGGGPGGPGTGSGGNGTPDSFYDDLKNLDYAVVPPSGIAAPNYDELPSQAELRAPGAKDDSDYALPPAHPSDKRSLMSNTESIDSEDIAFRPECQLRLTLADAVDRLRKLETDFSERCSRLYKFIHSRWKAEASLALNMASLRPTITELNELLGQLVEFHYGVLNNARLEACPDRALCKKVWKHLRVFERNAMEFADAVAGIRRLDWNPRLVAEACSEQATDYLGFCVSSARDLQIQQRALSTAVHANAPLLFPVAFDQLDEKVIPIETEDWGQQQQMQRGSQNQNATSDYMRMNLLTDSTTGLPPGDRELLVIYSERLRMGSEAYAVMCQDLQGVLSSRQSSGAVIGSLCRSLVSRAYKLSQMAAMLHEGLHSVQLKSALEHLISRLGHQLKAILRTSKAVMETAPAEWQQQLAGQLSKYIAESLDMVRELSQLVMLRATAGVH